MMVNISVPTLRVLVLAGVRLGLAVGLATLSELGVSRLGSLGVLRPAVAVSLAHGLTLSDQTAGGQESSAVEVRVLSGEVVSHVHGEHVSQSPLGLIPDIGVENPGDCLKVLSGHG